MLHSRRWNKTSIKKVKQMATKYVDFNGGNDGNNGSSFALRKKTLSSAAAVAAAGDVIRVMGKPSTNSGTATWTKGSPLVIAVTAVSIVGQTWPDTPN
jgi:hypothetical protein